MSLIKFIKEFGDNEEACLAYLEAKRWPDERSCPHCGSVKTYKFKNGRLFKCGDCLKQFTAKVGTIFSDSKVPLDKWFIAIYMATSLKKGVSSVQLSKQIEVTQKTAWFMLHRIRYAIEVNDGDLLGGSGKVVEVDETYVGGKPRAYEKRGWKKEKGVVFGAIERGGKVRVTHVRSSGARVLLPKIDEQVAVGTTVASDQWGAYRTLPKYGYTHISVNHGKLEFVSGLTHTQNIEAAWSHFKRSLYGVYHAVSRKHLQKYCSEFEYRYNTRTVDDFDRFGQWFGLVNARLMYCDLIQAR